MEFDLNFRNELLEKAKTEEGLKLLYEQAKKIDEKALEIISPNDSKRIIRAVGYVLYFEIKFLTSSIKPFLIIKSTLKLIRSYNFSRGISIANFLKSYR